jgi:hypothetical protein
VIAACYVEGVSTRRVDDVAKAMGVESISKSQVSRICAELDEVVAAWRNRPLDSPRIRSCGLFTACLPHDRFHSSEVALHGRASTSPSLS